MVTSDFFEACDDTNQWDVTGKWRTSRGECSAKNTDAEHSMTTIADIDLSNKQDAFLTYKYHIDNADAGEFMRVFISNDGGVNFVQVQEILGSQSGSSSINIADHVPLTAQMRLKASCLVDQNNESCNWDDIVIETADMPTGPLQMTIDTPQPVTYGPSDFPLTYSVTISNTGSVDYSLVGETTTMPMIAEDGSFSGTTFTAVEGFLSTGSHRFEANATDTLGNANTASVVFSVDNATPAVEFVFPTPLDGSVQSDPAIQVKSSTNSGLDHYSFVEFDGDLYLWLTMDDVIGNTVLDLSPYFNDGVAEGDAVQVSNGKFGQAFEFDGIDHGGSIVSDRILIPGFQDRHQIFDTSFTVMAWAKPDVSEKMVIIGNKSITALPGWHLRTSGGNHRLRMGVNTGFTSATSASAEAHTPMVAGQWVHVVGIYDSTVPHIQLYLDGVLEATKAEGVSAGGYSNNLELALSVPEDPQKTWDGLIDEVLIFSRVLAAAEIRAMYDSTVNQYQATHDGLGLGVHEFTGYSFNSSGR